MSSLYTNPYMYDNPCMAPSVDRAKRDRDGHHHHQQQHKSGGTRHFRTVHPQHSYRPALIPSGESLTGDAYREQRLRNEIIATAATLPLDEELQNILRKAVYEPIYMPSIYTKPHIYDYPTYVTSSAVDQHQSLSHKHKQALGHSQHSSTLHSIRSVDPKGHSQHTYASLAPVLPYSQSKANTYVVNQLREPTHTIRMPATTTTAETLSSVNSTDSQRPLRPFYEVRLQDNQSASDSDSVGVTKTKAKTSKLCPALISIGITLSILLVGVTIFALSVGKWHSKRFEYLRFPFQMQIPTPTPT